jgi:hypothetical protein
MSEGVENQCDDLCCMTETQVGKDTCDMDQGRSWLSSYIGACRCTASIEIDAIMAAYARLHAGLLLVGHGCLASPMPLVLLVLHMLRKKPKRALGSAAAHDYAVCAGCLGHCGSADACECSFNWLLVVICRHVGELPDGARCMLLG